jgi:UDP-galactopyranose mutase
LRFEHECVNSENVQGNAVINYTSADVPFTRTIEHKHFEFGGQPVSIISREYPQEWHVGDEPYYPINNERNNALYERYRKRAADEEHVFFCGRLGTYRYLDMDDVVKSALVMSRYIT